MYTLEFATSSKKELKKVEKHSQAFILDSLEDFIESFSTEYELYRLKLRSYRVIYKKYEDKLVILVVHVTTRESAYR